MAKKLRRGTIAPKKKLVGKKQALGRSSPRRGVGVTEEMAVNEVLQVHPETLSVFASFDLSCLGDERQQRMTVQSWALDHGVSVKALLGKLNSASARGHAPGRKGRAHAGL